MEIRRAMDDIAAIFTGALDQVDPARLVTEAVRVADGAIVIDGIGYPIRSSARLVVIGFGKASLGMARGIEDVLGGRIDRGIVVAKRGSPAPDRPLSRIQVAEASHPVPDGTSLEAARRILDAVAGLSADDLVLVLISGGGSALLEMPADGVSIADLAGTTDLLLRAGVDIRTLNIVRHRLSRIKGGGLARAALPARMVNLIISDVLGNPVEVIAGGPTVEPAGDEPSLETIIRRLGIWDELPESIRFVLRSAVPGRPPAKSQVPRSVILADAGLAADGAAEAAREIGYAPVILSNYLKRDNRCRRRYHTSAQASLSRPRKLALCLS